MDYIQHSGNLGEYIPSFFQMKLRVDDILDVNTCSDHDFALFFHEYIHFLQDITTTYGLTRCYYYGEYIQTAVNDIYKGEDGTFKVPITYNDPSHHVTVQDVITRTTMGDSDDVQKMQVSDIIYAPLTNLPIDSFIKQIDTYCIDLGDDFRTFGAYAIKESIAYIMERKITVDYEESPEYPYCAAEKIVELVYPEFGKNILNVLALCDCSLMFTNPGDVFCKTLFQLKAKNYIPNKPHDIYDQLKHAKVGIAGSLTDPFKHFTVVAEEARSKLKSYFNVPDYPELHKAYHSWVDRLIDYAIHIRLVEPAFLIDMVSDGYARTNNTFSRIIENLGSPLVQNKRKDYFTIRPKGIEGWTSEVMKSVLTIYDLLHDGNTMCSLYPWCDKTDKELAGTENYKPIAPTIAECLHTPWERCKNADLCPFAIIWRNWNLTKYTPVKS